MSAKKRRQKAINRRRWILELLCKHQGLDMETVLAQHAPENADD